MARWVVHSNTLHNGLIQPRVQHSALWSCAIQTKSNFAHSYLMADPQLTGPNQCTHAAYICWQNQQSSNFSWPRTPLNKSDLSTHCRVHITLYSRLPGYHMTWLPPWSWYQRISVLVKQKKQKNRNNPHSCSFGPRPTNRSRLTYRFITLCRRVFVCAVITYLLL